MAACSRSRAAAGDGGMPQPPPKRRSGLEAVDELRRQGDLRHQDQALATHPDRFRNRLEIDLGLAEAGDPFEQRHLIAPRPDALDSALAAVCCASDRPAWRNPDRASPPQSVARQRLDCGKCRRRRASRSPRSSPTRLPPAPAARSAARPRRRRWRAPAPASSAPAAARPASPPASAVPDRPRAGGATPAPEPSPWPPACTRPPNRPASSAPDRAAACRSRADPLEIAARTAPRTPRPRRPSRAGRAGLERYRRA